MKIILSTILISLVLFLVGCDNKKEKSNNGKTTNEQGTTDEKEVLLKILTNEKDTINEQGTTTCVAEISACKTECEARYPAPASLNQGTSDQANCKEHCELRDENCEQSKPWIFWN